MATPFVQGHLRSEYLATTIQTECGHCRRPLRLQVDSEMKFQVEDAGATPLVFVPMVNFERLDDPSIIDVF